MGNEGRETSCVLSAGQYFVLLVFRVGESGKSLREGLRGLFLLNCIENEG